MSLRQRSPLLLFAALVALLAVAVVWRFSGSSSERASVAASPEQPADGARLDERLPEAPAPSDVSSRKEAAPAEVVAASEPAQEIATEPPRPEPVPPFWCRVVAMETGEPVARASLSSIGGESGTRRRYGTGIRLAPYFAEVEANGDGLAQLVVEGEYGGVGEVEAAGFGPVVFTLGPGHETPERALVLRLARGAELVVRVEDAAGQPVPDVGVTAQVKSYAVTRPEGSSIFGEELVWGEHTGADGGCVLTDLPPQVAIAIQAFHDHALVYRSAQPLVLEPGERREVVWRIGGGARVSGWLIDQFGNPVAGRELWRTQEGLNARLGRERFYFYTGDGNRVVARTETDARGHFVFEDVAPGTWFVGPSPYGSHGDGPGSEAVAPVASAVQVLPGDTAHEVELRVHRGLYIHGRVEDPDGEVPSQVSLSSFSEIGSLRGRVRRGVFQVGPLEPLVHRVKAGSSGDFTDSDPVEATPPAEGLLLVLGAGARLAGHFVDGRTGEACEAALVVSCEETGYFSLGMQARPDFERRGLEAGTYHLTAHTPAGAVGLLRGVVLEEGASVEDLELRLEPGARLRVRYEGPSAYAQYRVLSGGAVVAGNGLRSGTTELEVVPAGEVLVRVSFGKELMEERRVLCTVGEETEVSFVFE